MFSFPVYPQMPKDSANGGSKGHKFGCKITPPSSLNNNKTMFLITQKMGQVVGPSQTRTLYTGLLLYMWNRTEIVQFYNFLRYDLNCQFSSTQIKAELYDPPFQLGEERLGKDSLH